MNLEQAFRAGFTRRWHSNPDLCGTVDPIDGHQGRVARIILMLHPNPTVSLLKAALTHDDGEGVVGDTSGMTKADHPQEYGILEVLECKAREAIWGPQPNMLNANRLWLRFADKLDAYMWAAHHKPHVMAGDGWPEAGAWLLDTCHILIPCNDTRREMKAMISRMGRLDAARDNRIAGFVHQFGEGIGA